VISHAGGGFDLAGEHGVFIAMAEDVIEHRLEALYLISAAVC
jgi:hypothetical protein